MLGGFVATVLGIAVTLGVSKCTDMQNNREIIRASVFNGLSDLDNYEMFLREDSVTFAQLDWLPSLVMSYYYQREYPADSVSGLIQRSMGSRTQFDKSYQHMGKEFLLQNSIGNEQDMETFRIINIAYQHIDQSMVFLNEMKGCLSALSDCWFDMYFSRESYTTQEVCDAILSHRSAHKLIRMMDESFEMDGETMDFFGYYQRMIQEDRERIMKFANIQEEEYLDFKEERYSTDKKSRQ